jgi:hypothetical protein
MARVMMASDGTPSEFDAAFTASKLMTWMGHARLAMAHGTPGIAVGKCGSCATPLVISSKDEITLPCPHCKEPVKGPSAEVLIDQWPEPWTKIEGGGLDLEYRLALIEADTGLSAGCAACGQPTPATDSKCARCGAVAWVERGDKRVQLGVRVNGTRQNRPYNGLVSIIQGEQMLRSDAALGTSDESSRSCLGISGLGCAAAVFVFMLLSLAIGYCAYFSKP